MLFDVVTACWNSAQTIERSIGSVLSQELQPHEYIFVDGGSTDGTLQIVNRTAREAATRGSRTKFTVLSQGRARGIPHAWNMGVESASSDIVFILNSDDWYEPNAASHVVKRFREDPELGILAGAMRTVSADGTDPRVRRSGPLWTLPATMPINHPACFVRRDVYRRIGMFNEEYRTSADYEFIYRCRRAGIKFARDRTVLTNMMRGGYCDQHPEQAANETLQIGIASASIGLIPRLAHAARRIRIALRRREAT